MIHVANGIERTHDCTNVKMSTTGVSELRGAVRKKLSRLPRACCGLYLERELYPGNTYAGHDGAARKFSVASPINNAHDRDGSINNSGAARIVC